MAATPPSQRKDMKPLYTKAIDWLPMGLAGIALILVSAGLGVSSEAERLAPRVLALASALLMTASVVTGFNPVQRDSSAYLAGTAAFIALSAAII